MTLALRPLLKNDKCSFHQQKKRCKKALSYIPQNSGQIVVKIIKDYG